jgi:hypothetical protein
VHRDGTAHKRDAEKKDDDGAHDLIRVEGNTAQATGIILA